MPPTTNGAGSRQSILPLFPLLASHHSHTRIDAALDLLNALPLSTQTPASSPAQAADTPYALKRLVAGLASSNDAARQGFAVALAQLTALLPDQQHAAQVLPQLMEATSSRAGIDAREERDLLFARLVGLHALVRSGVLVRADGPTVAEQGQPWKDVLLALVALSNRKSWIREPSYWVVCEALRSLLEQDAKTVQWRDEAVQWAVQRLIGDARERARGWSPEKVAIVLVLQSYNVASDWSSLLAPTFSSGSLLSRSSLSNLASALKGALATSPSADASSSRPSMGSNAVKTSKNNAAPAPGQGPHFVWTLLADAYFPTAGSSSSSSAAADKAAFSIFWTVCVDQALFGSSSLPLKALGFSLIQLYLPRLVNASPADVTAIFGPNTLRVLANHLRKDAQAGGEKTLARVAEKIVGSTVPAFLTASAAASGTSSTGLAIMKALVSPPHSQYNAFEPKVLDRIVAKLPLSAVKGWVAHLRSIVLEPSVVQPIIDGTNAGADAEDEEDTTIEDASDREKRITAQRTWAFDQLLTVVRSGAVPKDDELISSLLEFLAVVGWFEVSKSGSKGARSYAVSKQDARLTGPQRLAARSRFFSCLTALVGGSVPAPLGGPNWLQRALALLDNLAADEKHFTRAAVDATDDDDQEDEDEEARPLIERVKALYAALDGLASAKSSDEAERARAKTARALLEGVRLVCWDEGAADASDILEGAIDAVEALFPALASGKDDDDDEDEEGEKPEPGTILLDVVLALLRRPSAFVKAFAGPIVLKGFAGEIGQQAIELLGDVVAPADEVEEGIEAEEGAEVEKKEKKAEGESESGEDDDSDEEDSSDDDDEEDDEGGLEVDEAFKNELLAALEAGGMGVPNAASDDDDDDEEMKGDESDEEELLDDEAMLALDDRLADIFRANGGGRRSKKRDRQDDLHYRLRCLDLLDILAHAKPSSPFLIPLYVPLFNLIRTASSSLESELQTKAAKLLRFLVQPRKDKDGSAASAASDESAQTALDALAHLHRAAQSVDDASLAPLSAQIAVALVKAAVALSPAASAAETQAAVARTFSGNLTQYLTNKNAKTRCQPLVTLEAAKRTPAALWPMFADVVRTAGASEGVEKVNAYRRMQAFDVANTLLTSYAGSKSADSAASILAALPAYRNALYDSIRTSLVANSNPEMDAARLKSLAKHALAAARLTKQLSPAKTSEIWQPAAWAELVGLAKSKAGVMSLLKQVASILGAEPAADSAAGSKKEKKRKAAEAPAATAQVSTPQSKKQKKGKQQQQQEAPAAVVVAEQQAVQEIALPEAEVQDESVEADEDAALGDVSMTASEAAAGASPSKKEKRKKDKSKRRRESAGVSSNRGLSRPLAYGGRGDSSEPSAIATSHGGSLGNLVQPMNSGAPPALGARRPGAFHGPQLSITGVNVRANAGTVDLGGSSPEPSPTYPPVAGQSAQQQQLQQQLQTGLYAVAPASRKNSSDARWDVPPLSVGAKSKNRSKVNSVALALLLLSAGWFVLGRIHAWRGIPDERCDALHKPGRLLINLTSPLHTHWRPLDDRRCPPLPAYLPALWTLTHGPDRLTPQYQANIFSKEYRQVASDPLPPSAAPRSQEDPIPFLRKRRAHPPTVLVVGDSVDRNGLVHFCQLFRRNITISMYQDISRHPPGPYPADLTRGHGPKFDGWDQRGLMHRCEIPFASGKGIAMRVINGFHYGMDALDEFNSPDHNDWHAPGRIERRIDELFVPAIRQLGGPDKIDVVQLHSGMWDLALFGMQDDKTRWALTVPLTPEQLAWWQERMRHTIAHLRETFPRARLVFRKLHRTDDAVQGTQRVHQLRHLQEEVARSEGLPVFDFGHVLEGYQAFQEKVHPLLVPGGIVYAHNLVNQLRMALESKTSWRRGWLWDD
ncbi:hypothetical protein JCM10908_001261 [Rhodotorula pacifica]|uniref:DNA-directed DNA polymerase n=1 Tax=Rhodotorula pacifica TaxID=1495444 RepID=UPI00317F3A53